MKRLLMVIVLTSALFSCTDNKRARSFGGTETVTLRPNEKLLNVTWKDSDMWIITQDTVTGICYAREKSSLGILEGTIIIKK